MIKINKMRLLKYVSFNLVILYSQNVIYASSNKKEIIDTCENVSELKKWFPIENVMKVLFESSKSPYDKINYNSYFKENNFLLQIFDRDDIYLNNKCYKINNVIGEPYIPITIKPIWQQQLNIIYSAEISSSHSIKILLLKSDSVFQLLRVKDLEKEWQIFYDFFYNRKVVLPIEVINNVINIYKFNHADIPKISKNYFSNFSSLGEFTYIKQ